MNHRVVLLLFFISGFVCSLPAQSRIDLHVSGKSTKDAKHQAFNFDNTLLSPTNGFLNNLYSAYKDTTDECNIMLNNGSLLKDVKLLDSDDSTFTITKSKVNRVFGVAQLHRITFENHGFWKGFAVGAIASVAFWSAIGLLTTHTSNEGNIGPGFGFVIGLILAVPTGIVVGIISEFATNNDVYDFGNINPAAKSKRLKSIILKHKG